ncbi:hypothetical protein EV216_10831 [Rhodovulum steppense]|uniref:Uncharacterized protein n=1 Tax=Rhodovulum steppense TaxID=540251 RepID=A0A4R1YVN0_9RHOB|nr:hypothetical protein EV216_10831 [Rhodovulum steppense]
MAGSRTETGDRFDVVIVGQAGRLQYEAVLFAAALRASDPDFAGSLIVAEPQPGPLWPADPRMDDPGARCWASSGPCPGANRRSAAF